MPLRADKGCSLIKMVYYCLGIDLQKTEGPEGSQAII